MSTTEKWFKVRRTYRVEDMVFVQASSAADARTKVEDGDYDDVTDAEAISATRLARPRRVAYDALPYDVRFKAENGFLP